MWKSCHNHYILIGLNPYKFPSNLNCNGKTSVKCSPGRNVLSFERGSWVVLDIPLLLLGKHGAVTWGSTTGRCGQNEGPCSTHRVRTEIICRASGQHLFVSISESLGCFSNIQYMGLCVFSLPISLVMMERMYILCFIIIIQSEVWTIVHCLGSGHETMVCAVCLYIPIKKLKAHNTDPLWRESTGDWWIPLTKGQ